MFCPHCGQEINNNAVVCIYCGRAVKNINTPSVAEDDASSIGYAILGFFLTIIGIILYAVWRKDYPLRAKSCLNGALTSIILAVVLSIILVIVVSCLANEALDKIDNPYYY